MQFYLEYLVHIFNSILFSFTFSSILTSMIQPYTKDMFCLIDHLGHVLFMVFKTVFCLKKERT